MAKLLQIGSHYIDTEQITRADDQGTTLIIWFGAQAFHLIDNDAEIVRRWLASQTTPASSGRAILQKKQQRPPPLLADESLAGAPADQEEAEGN